MSTQHIHAELRLPTLEHRRQIHLSTECYESLNTQDHGLHYMFNLLSNTRPRATRQTEANNVTVPDRRTKWAGTPSHIEDQSVGMPPINILKS